MRWAVLVLNVVASVALAFLAAAAVAAHRTHAYSTYRELEVNRVLVEKPAYLNGEPLDVEARLRNMTGGDYYYLVGYLGAGACLLNGFLFFFMHRPRRHEDGVMSGT